MIHQVHPNRIRQILFLLVLIFIGIVIVKEMYFMLSAFLGAITLYVLLRNVMLKLVVHYKWKKWLAALFLIILSIIVLILPMIWLTSIGLEKIKPIIHNPTLITTVMEQIHQYLISQFQIDILNKENIAKLSNQIIPFAQKTIGGTMSMVGNLFIMYLILYFMLTETQKVESWIRNQIPFKDNNVQLFTKEFRNLVYSNAIGIPIVAIIQGIVGFFGYWIFGVEECLLMGILTAICSMIPVVGAMIVYIPLAIYTLSTGQTWQGVAIVIWGLVIIGSIDNVARFMLQKKIADVHPLVTIFGAFIGLSLFGFLGIIFGPLLLSMFFLLAKIYINEFGTVNATQPELII